MKVTRRMREGVKALRIAICYGEEATVCKAIRMLCPEFEKRADTDMDVLVKAQRTFLMESLEEIHKAFQAVKED